VSVFLKLFVQTHFMLWVVGVDNVVEGHTMAIS
jgi:hypothetical protein